MKKKEPIAKFALGLIMFEEEDGKAGYRLDSANQGVPIELIITQLRAYLKLLQDDYYDNFKKNTQTASKK